MDEKEIYEVLGMTPPGSGEDTARADETPPESPSVQADGASGPAAPAEDVSNSDTSGDGGETAAGTGDTPEGAEQPTEGRETQQEAGKTESGARGPSLSAAQPTTGPSVPQSGAGQEARWRALTQQEVQRAVAVEQAKNQAEWHEFFASAGLKNSLEDGKPITSLEEFRQWKSAYDRARLEQELKAGKLTPEMLEAVVAQQVASRETGKKNGNAPRAASAQVTKEQIDAELAEIHRLDGSVNGLEDILKMETGGAFQDAVRRGHSFLDAFKLANFDRLQSQRQAEAAQRAAQAARNSARSKEHLRASDCKSGGSVAVPGDVLEMYRMMMPSATEAEITAHYNRMLKEMKK